MDSETDGVGRLSPLEISLMEKRKRAQEYRTMLGIEAEWALCEESYEGIDDANRSAERGLTAFMMKPMSSDGGTVGTARWTETRSTVFNNITRPYVDSAAARVSDMLAPSDDRIFSLEPTPIPDLSFSEDGAMSPEVYQKLSQDIAARREIAEKSCRRAQDRIDDWLMKCQFNSELRKVIEDCAKIGSGVMKGPYPSRRKKHVVSYHGGEVRIAIEDAIVPVSRRIDPWNLFPDPSCGEDIHNGSFIFERDYLSVRQLQDLIGQPGYLSDRINQVLSDGPSRTSMSADIRRRVEDRRYEVWFYSGRIGKLDMEELYQHGSDDDSSGPHANVVVTIVNDMIIKATSAYLDSGAFCYDLVTWQRRVGMPWGIGIAKQINVPQRMVNGAIRNMSDNAALSSAPQIVRMRGVVEPADGIDNIVPRKVWWVDPNTPVDDIRKAFMAIQIPTMQQELLNIAQFALEQAETVTGMPMLMQGKLGASPGTVGGMEMLNNNASSVLRRIATLFDDGLTEPHIRRYYEWLLIYGDDEEKGQFEIDARGSTSLVDRDVQRRAILSLGAVVTNPAYGVDPELWMMAALKANKVDPSGLMITEKKKLALQQQANAQQQSLEQMQQQKLQLEQTDIEAQLAIEDKKARSQAQLKAADIAAELRIAEMKYNDRQTPGVAGRG